MTPATPHNLRRLIRRMFARAIRVRAIRLQTWLLRPFVRPIAIALGAVVGVLCLVFNIDREEL